MSFSRPVWPQFRFYPLRCVTQGTQSDERGLQSGFGGVGNSSILACFEITKSGAASTLSHQVLLWTPQQVQSSGCMYGNGLGKGPWGVCAPPLLTQLAFGGRGMGESRDTSDAPEFKEDVPRRAFRHQKAS